MGRRLANVLLACWWLTWVLVIIPAHTRGAISLGGCSECKADNVPFFFGTLRPCCQKSNSTHPATPQKSSDNCAICQIVATTPNTPPAAPLLIYLHLQEILPPLTPSGATHYFPIHSYNSRAPPIA